MHNFINKFGIHTVVVLLLIAAILFWLHSRRGTQPTNYVNMAFYVDEETGEESVLSIDEIPPLPGKSGRPTVVRARKFSCEGGANPKTLYLQKYTDEAKSQMQSLPSDSPRRGDLITFGELVRSPEPGSQWFPATSSQGLALSTLPDCPNGQPMTEAAPQK